MSHNHPQSSNQAISVITSVMTIPTTVTHYIDITSSTPSTSQITSPTSERAKWISSNTNVISYTQAASYAGQPKTVEGTIVRTYASNGNVFLDFHNPYQGYFYAVIFSSSVGNFKFQPASFYLNKDVRITGPIQMYQGSPEIIVNTPSQIEVANMGFNYP